MEMKPRTVMQLTPEMITAIEQALSQRSRIEIGVKNNKICVWEIKSKTKYEQPIA